MKTTVDTAIVALLLTASWLVPMTGCSQDPDTTKGPYTTVAADPRRDTEAARKLTAEGTKLLAEGDYEQAQERFKSALAADLFYGPAHNNLGLAYYHQEKYYLAAWELQYAANLMPNQADPRNNLGLVFEAVGKLDEAADWYQKALALEPEAIEPLRHLARTRIRQDRYDPETRELLEKLVMKETDPAWRTWAQEKLRTGSFGSGDAG
jgi:Tfp pilus assembly protein PilF